MRNHLAVLSPSTLIVEGFKQMLTGSNWELARLDSLGAQAKKLNGLKLTVIIDLSANQPWVDQLLSEIDPTKIVRVCHLHAQTERHSVKGDTDASIGHLYFNMTKSQMLEAIGVEILQAPDSRKDLLTSRERQIEELMVQGKSTDEIALALFISNQTAKTHRKNILRKLGVKNTLQLILQANKQAV
jgi:DNA-binding CsgD family transcriptional regulator